MSRRIIDFTSPGGQLKTEPLIESFVDKTAKLGKTWESLSDKTASVFLSRSGWTFDQESRPTFVYSSLNSDNLDIKKYHTVELSKYGQCHVINNLPPLKNEGPGQGLKLILNVMHEAYPMNEFSIEDVEGFFAGIRVFFDDSNSEYFDYRHANNIPIGTYASIGLRKQVSNFLEPPHGICNNRTDFQTDSQCFVAWYTKEVIKHCNCKTFFDKSESVKECTLTDVIECKEFLQVLKNKKPDNQTCPQLCKEIKYETKISYSEFSMTNVADVYKIFLYTL